MLHLYKTQKGYIYNCIHYVFSSFQPYCELTIQIFKYNIFKLTRHYDNHFTRCTIIESLCCILEIIMCQSYSIIKNHKR